MLLGWNSTLYNVPGDDQQDNRQVGVRSSHIKLIYLVLHHKMSASNDFTEKQAVISLSCAGKHFSTKIQVHTVHDVYIFIYFSFSERNYKYSGAKDTL